MTVRWSNFAGWGDAGNTGLCTEYSHGACPFVSPKSEGWRWTLGMGFECNPSSCSRGNFLKGYLDEIRISSTALDLEDWRIKQPPARTTSRCVGIKKKRATFLSRCTTHVRIGDLEHVIEVPENENHTWQSVA
eukprot:753509-Hanusia_phi.AAC.5